MRRAALLLSVCLVSVALLIAPVARAQDASASQLHPSESACLGQSHGSACDSSSTIAGGTCLTGCCCHFSNGADAPPVCAACLACSDTSGTDPAFTTTPCTPDGGAVRADGGTTGIVVDAGGMLTPTPAPASGGCSSAPQAAQRATPSIAGFIFGVAAFVTIRRRRARRS